MAKLSPQEKAKKDLRNAEIVYYTIGAIILLIGLFCSVCSFIITNPIKQNFESSWVLKAQTMIFTDWLGWEFGFQRCGLIFMSAAIVYFMLVMYIFTKKGDEVAKRNDMKKSRQRQVVYVAPVEEAPVVDTTIDTTNQEKAE